MKKPFIIVDAVGVIAVIGLLLLSIISPVRAHVTNYVVVAKYGTTPDWPLDGTISTGEWDDASTVTFTVAGGGTCTVYVKQDGSNLYVAFDIPDTTTDPADASILLLDVGHNGGGDPLTDDLQFYVTRGGWKGEYHGGDGGWPFVSGPYTDWTASSSSTAGVGFQVEYSISYSKIGVIAGEAKTLGVAFESFDHEYGFPDGLGGWPDGSSHTIPGNWGNLTSDEYFWIPEIPSTLVAIALIFAAVIAYPYMRKRRPLKIPSDH